MAFKRTINSQRGMTLLELLVMMVLLAIISALLIQGLAGGLSTYDRVNRRQFSSQPVVLTSTWFTNNLHGIQAELDEPRQLTGNGTRLTGVSNQPLVGKSGEVQPFIWQLRTEEDGRLTLNYHQGDIDWVLLQWPAGSEGHFFFRDEKGAGQGQWPPTEPHTTARPDGRIPSAILLEVTPPQEPTLRWYVQLPGRTYPRSDYRDL